ncbi:hypothetical protein VB716_12435 [Synechococcus sp. CCY9201]|jgi:hypothetical protein|uniref:hypothetical protein n=1 Tax=unclassified Synechococcus TaxID=2626047 RepID=UPI0018CDA273|nr:MULTISPECIES: hypothetical protein [unclassified Synechococcus]MEA5475029.1 hypothetical protein [Synechococcus sp. CCY9201]QPN59500.1 hypothetical protein H8F24_16050 [Synechococcus sp. CBW1002]
MTKNNHFEAENDPFKVQQISMADIEAGDIAEMGLHLNLSERSYYFDFKITPLSKEMKTQLYKQIQAFVYTDKELHNILSEHS